MADLHPNYFALSTFYEQCLAEHGPTPQGVDWPNEKDANKRLQVMTELFVHETDPLSLLDLGCGYGALAGYLKKNQLLEKIQYTGIDLSEKMIHTAQALFPQHTFLTQDIINIPLKTKFDYVIMNGVFTEKRQLSWNEMLNFAQTLIKAAFDSCNKGIAFNVMSNQVDWCRPELFHWSMDDAATFLFKNCTRHTVFRNDYGLYEYTIYAYKHPR